MGFFKLILKVFFKLILNFVNKGLRIFEVLLKEGFEVRSYEKSGILVATLVLGPFECDNTI